MAINEKILNVRIKNKIHDYDSWITNDPVLLAGEPAFVTVATVQDGVINTVPSVMMKVGDGEHKFSELDWLYAKASNVYGWATAKDKPTYAASEITGISDYISQYVETEMGISVDTDTQYQIVKVDDYNYKLQSKGKGDAAWADVVGSVVVIPNKTADIEALQALVGEKAVATQISEAIAALDLANTYEAKGEAAKVQTALNEYKTTNDAAVQKNATDISGEIARAKAAEEANANAITAIKDGTTIDSFKDVEEALAGKEASGAAAQALIDAKAYADGKDAAIAEAKKAGTDAAAAAATAQGEIDALEEKVGTVPEGQTVMGIITNIQENAYDDTQVKADIAQNAADIEALEQSVPTQISTAISDLKLPETYATKVHTHVKADITDFAHNHEITEVNGLEAALEGKQAVGDYATKAEAQGYADAKDEAIAAAKTAGDNAQAYAEGVAGDLAEEVERAKGVEGGLETRLAAVEGDYLKAADKEALQNQINTIMNNPDTEGVINSITEFTQYIEDHGEIAEGFRTDIDANKEAIEALEGLVGETSVESQINAAIEALKIGDYAKAADLTAAVARVAQNETDIGALEGRMDTAEGKITTLETEVAKKANDADLAAIAKTGNVNDLVQTEGDVIIFNCGDSQLVF